MLIGAEIFWDLLCVGQIKSKANLPTLQKTHLGWIVSGTLSSSQKFGNQGPRCHFSANLDLQQQLHKFWAIEETPVINYWSPTEIACEEHFLATTTRNSDGRFVVKLPLQSEVNSLGDSRANALKRFYQLERKLLKNPTLKEGYHRDLNDYKQKGHLELVPDTEIHTDKPSFYLPHHAVLKEASTSTKLRVVFDASAKSSSGTSLNDLLMIGPVVQDDLLAIIIRFRVHRHVLTADIVQMYRQILIHPDHVDLQRILWREDPEQPVETFRLKTITFGTSSAPFMAIRSLNQLAVEESQDFPETSIVIKRDFYVDDLLTGTQSRRELSVRKSEMQEVLARAGFQLHKWNSDCPELRDQPSQLRPQITPQLLPSQDSSKTLGLFWDSTEDQLSFQVKPNTEDRKCTKRHILAVIAGIFDPLGLLGPVIVVAKMLLQRLWQLACGWDESVPISLRTEWLRFQEELSSINKLRIPRCVVNYQTPTEIEMHGFCDASESAYGACIYLRSTSKEGNHDTVLLCAKSRVAPLKTISIPRLELCSTLLLSKLANKITISLHCHIENTYLWSDSTVALAWIASSPHRWKTFVANRVSEIHDLTPAVTWNHVKSEQNPADLLSRGASASGFADKDLWWHGPVWLRQDKSQWPSRDTPSDRDLSDSPELRNTNHAMVNVSNSEEIFYRFSSLSKLIRTTAYCLRFKENCLSREKRYHGVLQLDELQNAERKLAFLAQRDVFYREIHDLSENRPINSHSKLLPLAPFLDTKGLLRVGGRLQHANISSDQRNPIVLPSSHPFTSLIIHAEHLNLMHAGPQATLASVRLRYWPICGRNTTRGIIRRCIKCFRVKPNTNHPMIGQLPDARINPSRPFSMCGVDFAGPFLLREGIRSSRRRVKAYIAIFVCFSTKAAHLELVSSLSTEAFLSSLKRFVSRRGKPTQMFSDNATNFVGAQKELRLFQELLNSEPFRARVTPWLAERGVKWSFIPPAAPHFGGLWEAAVKACKHHLRRVVGDASLTFEEFYTMLVQVESCLNSRPITPLSSDPNDLSVLTPGHFLIGDSLNAIGEPTLTDVKLNRLSRWQRVQQLTQHFWSRWSKEYLSQLQQRQKWTKSSDPLLPGALVLIQDNRVPPLQWPLGRVIEVHPGIDGVVRVATVRTIAGLFKRAVRKLCVLPLEK